MSGRRSAVGALAFGAAILSLAPRPSGAGEVPGLVRSWIGNTFPYGGGQGIPRKWVPQDVEDICVAPDGTVYTNVWWEEGGANLTEIRGGDVVAQGQGSRGWGHEGGLCVAANSRHVFMGQRFDNEGGGLEDPQNWPPKGSHWFGVSRRSRSDIRTGDPFEGGKGGKESPRGCLLVVHETDKAADLTGLAATDRELFVASAYDDMIRVYDAQTMRELRSWQAHGPRKMAVDAKGMLWVVEGDELRRVTRYSPDGRELDRRIRLPEGARATDVCVDRDGRLLVADGGPQNQVRVYDNIDRRPRLAGTIGAAGGVFAPPRGRVGPLRFNAITGVGSDDKGNLYVASTQRPAGGGGCVIECYSPARKLLWRAEALEFVDRAAEDPGDHASVYTKDTRYALDWSRPAGKEWTYAAFTLDAGRYPDDPRMTAGLCSPFVARIEGRRFLFMNGQNDACTLGVFRFDERSRDETAIPCVLFSRSKNERFPHSPPRGAWIWRDSDGNGRPGADEFLTRGDADGPWAGGFWVDEDATVWFAGGDVRAFRCQGLGKGGVPLYDFEHMETFPKPAPFEAAKRVRYLAREDVMFLGGTTPERKNIHWKGMGPVLARYDRWSKGNREARWEIVGRHDTKYGGGHVSCEPLSFDVAGDYVFVALAGPSRDLGVGWGTIDVHKAADGSYVGFMEPTKELGQVGLMDMVESVRAFRRSDGEYVVLEEDDYAAKNLMYRWRPGASAPDVRPARGAGPGAE